MQYIYLDRQGSISHLERIQKTSSLSNISIPKTTGIGWNTKKYDTVVWNASSCVEFEFSYWLGDHVGLDWTTIIESSKVFYNRFLIVVQPQAVHHCTALIIVPS